MDRVLYGRDFQRIGDLDLNAARRLDQLTKTVYLLTFDATSIKRKENDWKGHNQTCVTFLALTFETLFIALEHLFALFGSEAFTHALFRWLN
jgi:hypothetical protein